MNKIYNNLNIENLIRTEWFNQFTFFQKGQILKGTEQNLDVSVYAKSEFDSFQMKEIRKGLENNVDFFVYAKNYFTLEQMREIR